MLNSLWKDRKLNEEPVNRSSKMEDKTMKKRSIATITAILMSLVLMGCTDGTAAPVAQTINRPTEAPTVEVKPTEAPTPTEAVVETAEPTEKPKNPYIIDGISFKAMYDEHNWTIYEILELQKFDYLRLIVLKDWKDAAGDPTAVLDDGNSFVEEEGSYGFILYTPKKCKEWTLNSSEKFSSQNIYPDWILDRKMLPDVFYVNPDATVENGELSITVTYEDDTQETITVYITKDYTL